MERKPLIVLVLVSFLLCNAVAYFDEGLRSFNYLTQGGDWIALLIYTLLFLIAPLILFYSYKRSKQRLPIALLGFTPVVILILLQIA